MASRLIDSLFVASYGAACAGGSVRFYAPGTTTPVNVYQDDAATVVVTQPVTLDQNGRTTVPVYAIAPMRAILYSSSGAQVADIERIDGDRAELVAVVNTGWPNENSLDQVLTALRTSNGAADGLVSVSGSGSVPRTLQSKLSEQRSVDDFGAVGDGITDDYPAITSAITAAAAAGGGDLLIPPGTYLVSQTVVMQSGVSLRGAGQAYSIIKNSSTTGNCISATDINSFYIDGIAVQASTASTGVGIYLDSCNTVTVSRVNITGHRFGIDSNDASASANPSQEHRYRDCKILVVDNAAARAIRMTSTDGSGNSGRHIVTGCNIATSGGNAATGLEISGTLNQVCVLANYSFGDALATGVLINSAHTGYGLIFIGNDFVGVTTRGLDIARTAGAVNFLMDIGNLWGQGVTNASDSVGAVFASSYSSTVPIRPLGNFSYSQTFAVNSAAVVDLTRGNVIHISATAAITVTIPAPGLAAAVPGGQIVFMCDNNSGGAVTWTFNAAYILSAPVAPASPTREVVTVTYHAGSWYETARVNCPS